MYMGASAKNYTCFQVYNFSGKLWQPGVINKDPIVWLDGDRPAYIYVCSSGGLPTLKSMFASM